jgi:hypothetical protein
MSEAQTRLPWTAEVRDTVCSTAQQQSTMTPTGFHETLHSRPGLHAGCVSPTGTLDCVACWLIVQEDAVLIDLVQKYGEKRWNMVANGLPGRTGKGCSHR